jgi:hypothetical protein
MNLNRCVHLFRIGKNDTRTCAATVAAGRAVPVARSRSDFGPNIPLVGLDPWLVVDRTLVQIFLSNGCTFCL